MKLIPKSRAGSLWRSVLAVVIVIGSVAAATAVAGLLKVADIAHGIITPSLPHPDVVLPQPGAPETLLLIGSDHRASDGNNYSKANTDTMMLVRINDSSSTINVLSVPRDLRVQLAVPGCDGTYKLNAAYSCGGPNLLIKTLKAQVFPSLQVNHIFDINFRGFSDLIDAIGCVYTDVDHRYFNQSQPAPSPDNYSSIDIQPGYQKLCGDNQAETGALAFVRFRHTDTDIVRNARQQDFLRWAKDGYSAERLFSNESRLVKIFGANTQTDHSLHTVDGLIDLGDLLINADKLTLKSIPFPAQFSACNSGGQTPCYVTATPAAMQSAYQHFITPTTASTAGSSSGSPHHTKSSASGLVADVSDGRNQALDLGKLGIPVYYPKLMPAATDTWQPEYCSSTTGNCDNPAEAATAYTHSYPRRYMIRAPGGGVYSSYRITVVLNSGLGEYYGIQGTAWKTPPILNAKSTTENVDGKTLQVFKNGARISLVAYHTPQGLYWVSNTLADALGNNQMIAIAASLTRAT
jgi:polyisoprenyl-teichoic acid--peptidoglycan teichoic acid transferase